MYFYYMGKLWIQYNDEIWPIEIMQTLARPDCLLHLFLEVSNLFSYCCFCPINKTGQLLQVNSNICEAGSEGNQNQEWRWILPYADRCQCSKVVMGGFNTWTPNRPFLPAYAASPLLSNNIDTIRGHYGLKCRTEGKCQNCVFSIYGNELVVD